MIDKFIKKCKESSLSVTPQRLAIYKTLLNDKEHPNPEIIYKTIKPDFPTISLATVYKTLETFAKHGIVSVVTPLHGTIRYDAEMKQHHHIVCTKCKKVIDVKNPKLNRLKIPEEIKSQYNLLNYNIQFNIICDDCMIGR